MTLPQEFQERMQELLGEDYSAFLQSYTQEHRRGLRVNTTKIPVEDFKKSVPFSLEPVPWMEGGFYFSKTDRPAQHLFYAAGLYYLQEPSAMAPAAFLPIEAGDRVLDLCAAPGGKATALAQQLTRREKEAPSAQRGMLIANEIVASRARALLYNLEKTGSDNFCVLQERPERLSEAFPSFFDKILVDAPCSGEGMFRKEKASLSLWSPRRIKECAALQSEILEHAFRMLKPGGQLLYSTCTFAPEENEEQIHAFLQQHPRMTILPITGAEGFSCGAYGTRLWPHRVEGEGHFLALLQKEGEEFGEYRTDPTENKKKNNGRRNPHGTEGKGGSPTAEQRGLLRDFLYAIVGDAALLPQWEAVRVWKDKAYLPILPSEQATGLHILRNGLLLGAWKKKRFVPAQALAMHLTEQQLCDTARVAVDSEEARAYLSGISFPVDGEDGWKVVLMDGFPLGWGKIVQGILKNQYPIGWRNTIERG